MQAEVRIPRRRTPPTRQTDAGLLETIRAAGSVSVASGDAGLRTAAARLAVAGILAVEELAPDGSFRPLTPADVLHARSAYEWRVSAARRA
ncbi:MULTISPECIES: hypothetical protein [Methylorubrum]|uniref:Uncharacterized protein n=1 Tax=Methylorubrum extorquens (strain ATCC 14718 / DSM 1338 / JCM 2805 / NCIMB 9133 / AM1) TaxID=272630 RepID=C5B595_METEA|nr:hypothetical protein [Methylorubrum extorquens]ACS43627.1 Hypothetical protein MexAM1_META2p0787 [Methylorubrum extorquens AM1]MCP1546569.1 hypothetical protein [Methylorubrum extorquens]MCP1591236.1 hypothetical protein [Methylorubrum extorquens]OAH19108.1 hypothetical protein AX289_30090 [Methylorubrum populi]